MVARWEVAPTKVIAYPLGQGSVAYLPSFDYLTIFVVGCLAVLILNRVHEGAVIGGYALEVIRNVTPLEDKIAVGNPESREDLEVGTLEDLNNQWVD